MTSYYSDHWNLYKKEKFSVAKFVVSVLNNNALINGAGLVCGILSVVVVL